MEFIDVKYYRYHNVNVGERYFRVIEGESEVLQIIKKYTPKKGRPHQKGIYYISYMTFIGSWGWKKKKNLEEISRKDFRIVLNDMIETVKNEEII